MKLKNKITKKLILIGVISIVLTTVCCYLAFWFVLTDQAKENIKLYGETVKTASSLMKTTKNYSNFVADDYRITLIDKTGKVLYDSSSFNATENHKNRLEVKQAINSGTGESTRYSATTGGTTYYYAVKLDDGNILRVAKETNVILTVFFKLIPVVIIITIFVFIICLFISARTTKNVIKPIKQMADNIDEVAYEEFQPFVKTISTQRKEIQKQIMDIQKEKDKIETLIANMAEGFLLLDMNGVILADNDSVANLLGVKAGSIAGKNIKDLDLVKKTYDCIAVALSGKGNTIDIEENGSFIKLHSNPVYSNGKQTGAICLAIDISDKHQAEKMRREFSANVSHELKTPLTSISGYAEMIEYGMAKDDDVKTFAGKIHKEAGRLVTLIGDIIELSELEESANTRVMQNIDILLIAQNCIETLEMSAERHRVTINLIGESTVIRGNESMLHELMYNLCDNAIRYNKPGGTVELNIIKTQGKVKIKVSDTGIGIPKRYQERVFERFYRVDKSRSKETGGTGLGLAIVKHIAQMHGAVLKIDSEEGKGTCISVDFPLPL